jgi:hypothetical protein
LRKKRIVFFNPREDGSLHVAYGTGEYWSFKKFDGNPIVLPWMGLNLERLSERRNEIPVPAFLPGIPKKQAEENFKAALLRIEPKEGAPEEMWVTNRGSQRSLSGESEAIIGRKAIPLDFSIKLDRFKMDEIEGTGKPASYESFVKIKNPLGIESSEHVYMNNPYKAAGFTFYQSSYFQDERGQYSSVFSVNRDPGRSVKYLGSLLLVLGLIVHFSVIHGYIFKQNSVKLKAAE